MRNQERDAPASGESGSPKGQADSIAGQAFGRLHLKDMPSRIGIEDSDAWPRSTVMLDGEAVSRKRYGYDLGAFRQFERDRAAGVSAYN